MISVPPICRYGLPHNLGPVLGSLYVNTLLERLTNSTGNATEMYLEFVFLSPSRSKIPRPKADLSSLLYQIWTRYHHRSRFDCPRTGQGYPQHPLDGSRQLNSSVVDLLASSLRSQIRDSTFIQLSRCMKLSISLISSHLFTGHRANLLLFVLQRDLRSFPPQRRSFPHHHLRRQDERIYWSLPS